MHACFCCRINACRHKAQQGAARGERRATRHLLCKHLQKETFERARHWKQQNNEYSCRCVCVCGGVITGTCGVIYGHESTTASCAFHSIYQCNLHTISGWFSQAAANYNINDWGCTTASGEEGSAQKSTREANRQWEGCQVRLAIHLHKMHVDMKRKRQDIDWMYMRKYKIK